MTAITGLRKERRHPLVSRHKHSALRRRCRLRAGALEQRMNDGHSGQSGWSTKIGHLCKPDDRTTFSRLDERQLAEVGENKSDCRHGKAFRAVVVGRDCSGCHTVRAGTGTAVQTRYRCLVARPLSSKEWLPESESSRQRTPVTSGCQILVYAGPNFRFSCLSMACPGQAAALTSARQHLANDRWYLLGCDTY